MSAEDQRREDLATELEQLANRLISRAFQDSKGLTPLPIPILRRITQSLSPDEWGVNPTGALQDIIGTAVDRLPKEPIDDATDMTWPEFGHGLYNLSGENLDHIDGRIYSHLLRTTFDQAGLQNMFGGTRQERAKSLRKKLAVELLAMERDAIAPQGSESSRVEDENDEGESAQISASTPTRDESAACSPLTPLDFIHRPTIESRFNALVAQNAKLIALVGFPGMGKTSLAEALNTGAPLIEFNEGQPNVGHLQMALDNCGLSKYVVTEENVLAMLAKLLGTNAGQRFVVLDNLQSTSELRGLVPPNTTATVVATCREWGNRTPSWCQRIEVDVMDQEKEAVPLVRQLSPSLSVDDAVFLARTLGCYPLAIKAACGSINTTGVGVKELCRSLRVDPGNIETQTGEKLRLLLDRTVEFLQESNPVAIELLACAVTADPHGTEITTYPHLYTCSTLGLEIYVCSHYGLDVGPVKYADAMRMLRSLFLVEHRRDPDGLPIPPFTFEVDGREEVMDGLKFQFPREERRTRVHVHPLVRSILRDPLQDYAVCVDDRLGEYLRRYVEVMPIIEQADSTKSIRAWRLVVNEFFRLLIRRGDESRSKDAERAYRKAGRFPVEMERILIGEDEARRQSEGEAPSSCS